MVRAAGDVAQQKIAVMHGRDDRHIGNVGAAAGRMIGDDDVAGRHRHGVADRADTQAEGAEVNRHVRGVDDQLAVGVEHRAREVQSLLDVRGKRRALEHPAHLAGNRQKTVREQLLANDLGLAAVAVAARVRGPAEHKRTGLVDVARPVGLDDVGAVRVKDERGALHGVAGPEIGSLVCRYVLPGTTDETALAAGDTGRSRRAGTSGTRSSGRGAGRGGAAL